jgi:D-tyrosyl-tRNA(Tyr) deacylase
MKAVLQRVKKASVTINGNQKRFIDYGLVIFAGFAESDDEEICKKVFRKIVNLRIFSNDEGKFDLSIIDVKGSILIVSQFTLYASCKKGKRPDFTQAAKYQTGKKLYDVFVETAIQSGLTIETGEFGADMLVEISNDGPVTIILDSLEI